MNDIAAIVVTYNRKQLLRECIESLMGQSIRAFDIWVIDNASTDGTGEMLLPWAEEGRINYRNTGKNLGGAGGFQYGVREAARAGYRYLWLMDDDTVPETDALEELMNAANRLDSFGFLSSQAFWVDQTPCRMNLQRNTAMGNLRDFSGEYVSCGAATFVSLLIPTAVVLEVGLPIGEFFIWADDLEYTRRISLKYPCYVIPASRVVHKCGTNNGGNIATDSLERIDRYRFAYRNEVYVYRREGLRGAARLIVRTPLHILRVLKKSPSRRLRRIGVILSGTFSGLSFRPEIEYPKASPERDGVEK